MQLKGDAEEEGEAGVEEESVAVAMAGAAEVATESGIAAVGAAAGTAAAAVEAPAAASSAVIFSLMLMSFCMSSAGVLTPKLVTKIEL